MQVSTAAVLVSTASVLPSERGVPGSTNPALIGMREELRNLDFGDHGEDSAAMTTMTISAFAKDAAAVLQRVMAGHESVMVKQGRRAVAVLLPPDVLQKLEDAADTREADRIYADVKSGKVKVLPLA